MDLGQSSQAYRRRRRPALACVECRRKKLRCDKTTPCSNCVRSKDAVCSYSHSFARPDLPTRSDRIRTAQTLSAANEGTASPPTVSRLEASPHGAAVVDLPAFNSLATSATSKSPAARSNTVEDAPAELPSSSITRGNVLNGSTDEPVLPTVTSVQRAVVAKTRYFGPSHWMNASVMFPRLFRTLEKCATPEHTEIHQLLADSKRLARKIKHSRSIASGSSLRLEFPSREFADKLVNAYLRTFEKVYRILHVPSFQKDYDRFWGLGEKADEVFTIKLKLCLAIGACFYDETFSLRSFAMQWIYDAQLWLAAPISEKSNMTVSGIQIMCLLHLARETAGVNADLVWVSSGALLRTAMYMGLHRDPANLPPMSILQAELRRRLWGTILELILQSSIASGGRPLISMDDFDTEPPANLDDEQLVDLEDDAPVPKPQETLTDASFLILLRNVLAVRLHIANLVNNFKNLPSYEDTLQHNEALAVACHDLSRTLQSYQKTNSRPSTFQTKLLELLTRPFFIALHMPFMQRALKNPLYYFSRKMVVETSLKLYRSCCPAAVLPAGPSFDQQGQDEDYIRLFVCGSGTYKSIITKAQMIAIEIITQLEEHACPGDLSPSIDFLHALRYMNILTKQRLYAGETNIKGHMCVAALEANVDALLRGLEDNEVEQLMARSILVSLQEGNEILESFAGRTPSNIDFNQPGEMDVEDMSEGVWAWDPLLSPCGDVFSRSWMGI